VDCVSCELGCDCIDDQGVEELRRGIVESGDGGGDGGGNTTQLTVSSLVGYTTAKASLQQQEGLQGGEER